MTDRNLTLPGVLRYQPKDLKQIFGHDNLFIPVGEVELAVFDVLAEIDFIPSTTYHQLDQETREQILALTTTNIEERERIVTKHDVRAWVQLAQELCSPAVRPWFHVPLTSYDPLDTGRILQFSHAYHQALKPALAKVVTIFSQLLQSYKDTLQIGRTHGQHALPITVGFWLATILHRLLYNTRKIDEHVSQLVGKISGAVGAYNAQVGLGIAKKCGSTSFEERVLAKLGLKPSPISTQILPPEPVAYFLFSCIMTSATLGQLGRDCRHLMRSEIAEIGEPYEQGQVGSSTMAHKRNPINFENLEGMWLRTKNEFGKVLDTLISEHQRELVGSSLMRDFPIILVNLMQQLNTLLRSNKEGIPFLARLTVNQQACQKNFDLSRNVILAEPIYLALQMAGYQGDAHKLVNERAMQLYHSSGIPLIDLVEKLAQEDYDLKQTLDNIPREIMELLHHPEQYVGEAKERTLQIYDQAVQALTTYLKV